MSDHVHDLISQAREQNNRYTYFLVSGSAASIGYSMTQIGEIPLIWPNFLFLLSVLSWAASIFFGIKILKNNTGELHAQVSLLQEVEETPPIQRETVWAKAKYTGQKIGTQRESNRRWQESLWFVGALFLLVWKVASAYPIQDEPNPGRILDSTVSNAIATESDGETTVSAP
jgi:hypothetical protein